MTRIIAWAEFFLGPDSDCFKITAWLAQRFMEFGLFANAKPAMPEIIRNSQGRKCLVIDDDPVSGAVLAKILELIGFEVDLENSGQHFLAKEAALDYDIAFLDFMMPHLDGLQVAAELKKRGYNSPVVIVSASVLAQQAINERDVKVTAFIEKPISIESVHNVLRSLPGRNQGLK